MVKRPAFPYQKPVNKKSNAEMISVQCSLREQTLSPKTC